MADGKETEGMSTVQRSARLTKIAISYGSNPRKEDLLNILYWTRQVLSLVIGVVAGVNHFVGLPVIIGFFGANLLFAHIYANKYAQIDDDKVEQHEVLTEALGLSFAVFMITWTLTHTFV